MSGIRNFAAYLYKNEFGWMGDAHEKCIRDVDNLSDNFQGSCDDEGKSA